MGLTSPWLSMRDARWFLLATDSARILATERALVDHMYLSFDAAQRPWRAMPVTGT